MKTANKSGQGIANLKMSAENPSASGRQQFVKTGGWWMGGWLNVADHHHWQTTDSQSSYRSADKEPKELL